MLLSGSQEIKHRAISSCKCSHLAIKRRWVEFYSNMGPKTFSTNHDKAKTSCDLPSFQEIPIIFLEDVYITGLCADLCGVKRKSVVGFKAMLKQSTSILSRDDVLVHYADQEKMKKLHRKAIKFEKQDGSITKESSSHNSEAVEKNYLNEP